MNSIGVRKRGGGPNMFHKNKDINVICMTLQLHFGSTIYKDPTKEPAPKHYQNPG